MCRSGFEVIGDKGIEDIDFCVCVFRVLMIGSGLWCPRILGCGVIGEGVNSIGVVGITSGAVRRYSYSLGICLRR